MGHNTRMALKVLKMEDVRKQEWDNFVYNHPCSFLWHTYDFIQAKNTWLNNTNESFAVVDEDDNILAVMPLYAISYKKYRLLSQISIENLGGWLCKDMGLSQNLLLEEYKKLIKSKGFKKNSINFATSSLCYDEDPLLLSGFLSQSARISVIDLTQELDTIWSNIRKGHKADIKKAERVGLTFKTAVAEDLDVYYKMHEYVCSKSALQPHNKAYFEFIFKKAITENNAFVGLAYHEDRPIAAVNYAIYKDKAVYWTGAAFEDSYKLGANHFLHWNMIKILKCMGVQKLDMGEVFFHHPLPKIQGIADFKRGFGGQLRPCYKY